MRKHIFFILFFLVLLSVAAGVFYFSVISSIWAKKPYVEKPEFDELMINSNSVVLVNSHIEYIANEMDTYRLHKDIRTGNIPEIEFAIVDTDEYFTLRIIEGKLYVEKVPSYNADIRIITDQATMLKILASDSIDEKITEEISNDKFEIRLIADEITLGMKGYKAIYEILSKNQRGITGNSIMLLNPTKLTIITKLIALLSLLAIIELTYFIEK